MLSNNSNYSNNNPNKKKSKLQPLNIVMLIVAVAVVVVLGYISLSKTDKKYTPVKDIRTNSSLFAPDAYSDEQVAKDKDALDSMVIYINSYKPNNVATVPGIVNEVNNFRFFITDANAFAYKYSTDTSFTNKVRKISNLLMQKQIHYFPVFRSSYSKIANRVMLEDNIKSAVSGANNTTLELIGDRYLDSSNVRIDYNLLLPHLETLRYKQVIFRAKSDNEMVKNYRINSLNDDVVM